ncbi:MAG: hypothetical protein L0K86_00390 [Actinomycetia bacterium]|nr:hypothetical protein [Actinomycetes bacterium]
MDDRVVVQPADRDPGRSGVDQQRADKLMTLTEGAEVLRGAQRKCSTADVLVVGISVDIDVGRKRRAQVARTNSNPLMYPMRYMWRSHDTRTSSG